MLKVGNQGHGKEAQYDKEYKLPGKQGKKGNTINSAAFAVNIDTVDAVEKIFFLALMLSGEERKHV